MASRIRVYNSNKEYYSINRKNTTLYKIHSKQISVSKYITKKTKTKTYFSGRAVLPTKVFDFYLPNRKYLLLRLHRTHMVSGQKDLWGYSYLLFFKDIEAIDSNRLRINCEKETSKKLRSKYSKISKHTRKTNGKQYISGKIYLNSELIGKKLFIIEFLPIIELNYSVSKEMTIFDRRETISKKETGKGYMLFYQDNSAKKINKSYKKIRTEKAHISTIKMLIKKNTIRQISKKKKIKPTSVWNHICIAHKKGSISSETLKKIIASECDAKILQDIVIVVEAERIKQLKELKKIHYAPNKLTESPKINITRNKLKELVEKRIGKHIPINMLEAITVYLNSIYKK